VLLAGRPEWQEAAAAALAADPAATVLISPACAAGLRALCGLLSVSCCGCVLAAAVPEHLLRGLVLVAKNFAPAMFQHVSGGLVLCPLPPSPITRILAGLAQAGGVYVLLSCTMQPCCSILTVLASATTHVRCTLP
jgi:hypothetical protein